MDKLIYTAMSGAKHLLHRQDALAQNLANASTTGYRADKVAFRAVPIRGDGAATRVFAIETTTGADFSPGPMTSTGRALDVAVQGPGWFTVQSADGAEAYTRAGNFQIGVNGMLTLPNGVPVLGEGGPIEIPTGAQVSIGGDGTVSASVPGAGGISVVGQLKLVNPPPEELQKGLDGLFRLKSGQPAAADPSVRVADGTLEGSNVEVVEAMVGMIAAARQFELKMKLLATAEQNEQRANTLLGNL